MFQIDGVLFFNIYINETYFFQLKILNVLTWCTCLFLNRSSNSYTISNFEIQKIKIWITNYNRYYNLKFSYRCSCITVEFWLNFHDITYSSSVIPAFTVGRFCKGDSEPRAVGFRNAVGCLWLTRLWCV